MNYRELKESIQKKYDEFSIGFAFSEKQLKEQFEKLGVKSKAEVIGIGDGGFIRKTDREAFISLNKEANAMLREFLKDYNNLVDALEYELANFEYCYSQELDEPLETLGYTIEDLHENETLRKAVEEAAKKYFESLGDDW